MVTFTVERLHFFKETRFIPNGLIKQLCFETVITFFQKLDNKNILVLGWTTYGVKELHLGSDAEVVQSLRTLGVQNDFDEVDLKVVPSDFKGSLMPIYIG